MEEVKQHSNNNIISGLNKPKILMVDDKPENLIALDRLLRDLNVETYKAENGNEALALTLHHDFALALLDIQMPEMDGFELAEILRQDKKTAQLPFIFISAIYTDSDNIFKGYEKGAFSFITKPFEPEKLLSKVRFFVEKHQQDEALKKHAEELQRVNEELESFSYSVSHDLRAPLRAVSGFSEIVLKKYASHLDEDGQRYLNNIVENAEKMGQLIDDILAFSRLGRQSIQKNEFDLEQAFQEVYQDLTQNSEYENITFNLHELPMVKGDYNLFKQVIQNLLSNALKYSSRKENTKIEVGVDKQDQTDVFYVRDNGAGFDMKYYDKLFGVFQRLHNNNDFEGNGVGLAFVKRIIERHNGKIWAKSAPNEGATFYFTINETNTN